MRCRRSGRRQCGSNLDLNVNGGALVASREALFGFMRWVNRPGRRSLQCGFGPSETDVLKWGGVTALRRIVAGGIEDGSLLVLGSARIPLGLTLDGKDGVVVDVLHDGRNGDLFTGKQIPSAASDAVGLDRHGHHRCELHTWIALLDERTIPSPLADLRLLGGGVNAVLEVLTGNVCALTILS